LTRSLNVNKILDIVLDAILVNASVIVGLLVRFEGSVKTAYLESYGDIAVYFTAVTLVIFYLMGLYNTLWRYASARELLTIAKAVGGSALAFGFFVYAMNVPSFPRSVVLLYWLVGMALIGGGRFSRRVLTQDRDKPRALPAVRGEDSAGARRARRVLVVGAGEAGAMVVRELDRHGELPYELVGLVDDEPSKQGMKVNGVRVLGRREDLPRIVRRHSIDEIVLAMPSAPGRVVRETLQICEGLKVEFKTVPGVYELLDGRVRVSQLRAVKVEDLLGREPVEVDLEEIAAYLAGRRVLVTGAAGSIGSELCRQICRFRPARLLLLDHDETGVYSIHRTICETQYGVEAVPIVGDVRDEGRISAVFQKYRPEVVFHAAACKHVPLMEENPGEAVKTNVFGTSVVAEAAREAGADRFILVSSDKAVNPTSVMGATKRLAEMIVQSLNGVHRAGSATAYMCVRFGNVLDSRGSVVPLFREQIARGGPVTVTDPGMVRYFMTIPEAAQLVIQAGAYGKGGEVFALDMGEPVRIVELARNMIRLSGLEPDADIAIEHIGPRPGEKLVEQVLSESEGRSATKHRMIFRAESRNVEAGELSAGLELLRRVVAEESPQVVAEALSKLVPTFRPEECAARCRA